MVYHLIMQIREISLTELECAYSVVKELYSELSYEAYEDLIYEMRPDNYKMIGLFERGELASYAGVSIRTSLLHGRHLLVHEVITSRAFLACGTTQKMVAYLKDYAKIGMCERILFGLVSEPFELEECSFEPLTQQLWRLV